MEVFYMSIINFNSSNYFWFNDFKPDVEINGGHALPAYIQNVVIEAIVINFVEKNKPPKTMFTELFDIIEFDSKPKNEN